MRNLEKYIVLIYKKIYEKVLEYMKKYLLFEKMRV